MHYPEMVKTNARYRGPRESGKQRRTIRDTYHSLDKVQEELKKREGDRLNLMGEIFSFYNDTMQVELHEIKGKVLTVKGGER